ncbi:MAG: response regulator [Planctomycetota bacterium]
MEIRIIIADDYPAIRRILCDVLESHPDMKIIGETGNGKDAIELCLNLIPDIVIVDFHMSDLNGIEVVNQIVPKLPQVKVLALSGDPDLCKVRKILRAGASGYVLKNFIPEDLVNAVRTIAKGGTYLSTKIKSGLLSAFSDSIKHLTYIEKVVLHGLSEGKCISDIALDLHLGPKVVYDISQDLVGKSVMSDIRDLTKYIIPGGIDCK